jgi:hypothetical protein
MKACGGILGLLPPLLFSCIINLREPLGSGTDGGVQSVPRSCAAALTLNPNVKSGIITVDFGVGAGRGNHEVYCDMVTAGGGWLLVGQSAPSGSGRFGWGSATGSPKVDAFPYSLNVIDLGVDFSEVLVGAVAGEKEMDQAYTFRLGIETFRLLRDKAAPSKPQWIKGPCKGAATMLNYVGWTRYDDRFHFRDNSMSGADNGIGLFANGFVLVYPECERSGELHTRQGAVYVR